MAKIIPFKAVRPTRDKVGLIASRSYDDYSTKKKNARLRDNPFSFLHIVNPGYKYQKTITGERRYTLVRNRYREFKEDGIFIQDEKPNFYFYKIINREGHEFNGIIAGASTLDYQNNVIKKHEKTLERKEIIFEQYLKTVGFNAEPVLLTYPDNTQLKEIIDAVMLTRAEYEFTTTYRDTHYVWNVDDEKIIKKIESIFSIMNKLYIADGHHRSASSSLLASQLKNENPDHNGDEPYNFFMSYLIPESDLKIYEFNRLIRDLNGLSKEEFLISLDESFRIENRGNTYYKPSKKHHFSMYLDGEYYSLYLRKEEYEIKNSLDILDVQILFDTILKPILGIKDVRNNNRIEYPHGKTDLAYIKSMIDSNEFKVGFSLLPISIKELKNVADEGLTMPPKSTFIEPKLRSGITIYEF
tara:strand:- start:5153 stop:6391 length:1239 start_codon:yes stop_codon:yes gene_type:complete